MKGELPVVGGRVPHLIFDKLQILCQETGQSQSDVLREALALYLNINTPESAQSLDKRVATLERKVNKLVQLV